ncbi:flagellar motor switch protein FliN [Thermocrinis albus DSM 14484]|uniref:Flagellar motor switch protein FliN n=1 Tax=Thermocrinis albus (strain DSM 14484 / JCM 11386 / HI 11/12) TaxID=638303 RepID=D3SPQ3_THEAH|nr:flagellar motor switch protein FliN [Thermocrinis albus]ADC89140.1 flagellar motor switch protein FliN [Thermocrinis albus DSM 14484]
MEEKENFQEDTSSMWEQALKEQQEAEGRHGEGQGDSQDLSEKVRRFLEIPLELEVVIGRTTLKLGELLHLGPGSVVELDNHVESPVDILVNGKLVAKGEIVVVEDKFGVRITDIIAREERIKGFV